MGENISLFGLLGLGLMHVVCCVRSVQRTDKSHLLLDRLVS